ncbi:ribose 5-phosphate isomerase B [Micavibrio aeruginosavorus]|uniref:Ribose 5-phosphate isomerase B n=1 Tax=Micavibrio aeruginosavorus (strain ARL-13) TaxID=856793 RepID=G2KLT8_MICAA|nr:ribose 5-phosphate isomerase B [Micavibrio aeruginosavorus]AEP09317.1 ribose 5-phosphate isomerase B [Micavibrio aeruginosavorus ARL-13]
MPDRQTLAIACDHAGFALKETLKSHFADRIDWIDLGANSVDSVSYADFGKKMGQAITDGQVQRGIIICGSGIGISIAANRFPAVRAALCTDATMAHLARQHNDANVLALGGRIIGVQVAIDCVEEFLNTAFEGGRHTARVDALGQC